MAKVIGQMLGLGLGYRVRVDSRARIEVHSYVRYHSDRCIHNVIISVE